MIAHGCLIERVRRISFVTVGMLALAACGGPQSRLASHMHRGETFYEAGDYARAGVEFRNALQIAPKDIRAQLMLGRASERQGRVREGAALYQAVIDADPDNLEARADLGRVFVFSGLPEQAAKIIDIGLRKHPDDVGLLIVRSTVRSRMSDDEGANEDAERAIKLAPGNPDAISLRAGLYARAGDYPQAIALLASALNKAPSSEGLREVLAQLYRSNHQPAEAEQQLRRIVQEKPKELRHRIELARFYEEEHRLDEAQRVLEEAVKSAPDNNEAKLTLVAFLSSQRTRAEGEKILRGFIAQQPGNYDLRLGLGDLLQRSGALKEAHEAYQEIVKLDRTGPKGLVARDRMAAMALTMGREEEAKALADEVLSKNPRDDEALMVRSEIALRRGDPTTAVTDLRAVLRDQPRLVSAQRLLARALIANDNPALAEQTLRAAIDSSPKDSSLQIDLAQTLARNGHADQAVSLLEAAVRDSPNDGLLRAELIRAYLSRSDYTAARSAAADLQTLLPSDAAGHYLAGLADEGAKRFPEADREYAQALSMQPEAFDILAALVRLRISRGELASATEVARASTERHPNNGFLMNILGECYLAQKNVPLAVATLNRAIELSPSWWLTYRNLALARIISKDPAGAVAAYTAGIKAVPHEARLITELASFYEQQGRIDEAISSYQAWRQANPKVRAVANNLAMMLVTYKQDQRSLDEARNLIADFASSSDGGLLDTYGWVHFKRAEYSEALPVLARAVERSPDSKEIRYHLGMAELRAGQHERARADLEAALSGPVKFRGSDEARVALASLKAQTG